MTIEHLHWHRYQVPLQQEFTTSQGTLVHRYGAILELMLANGLTGYGEVAPLPYFQQATLTNALARAPELTAELQGSSLEDALAQIAIYVQAAAFPPALLCGIEMALLDATGKQQQRSVASLLISEGALIRSEVAVNAIIGAGDFAACMRSARAAVAAGYTCIKLKVGMMGDRAQEVRRIAAVRSAIGPEIALRLDANTAWTLDEATNFLNACAPYHIQYVEQPLPADDLDGMCQLRRRVSIPIAADEALTDLASAERILDNAAADVLVIRPQTVGGLSATRQVVALATARGIECVLTSAIESGISIAATLQLAAALPEVTSPCGLATLSLLADDLIVEELAVNNGKLTVPHGAGLGVTLDAAALSRYAV